MIQDAPEHGSRSAIFYIHLSLAAALASITLKFLAWHFSGSISLLSDALESLVNLAGAIFALLMLKLAATPPDAEHPWGHNKAEYFSSGFEGSLIFFAAGAILWTAIPRLFDPQPLEALSIGLWFSVFSTVINLATALTLRNAGKRLHSVVLDADAAHLMTDVWTSAGVIIGLLAYVLTGWAWLDPVIAILVAVHILSEGWRLMRGAVGGLMDQAMDEEEIRMIRDILRSYAPRDIHYRHLRTRRSGTRRFAHVDILVPGDWSVEHAHTLLDEIEARIAAEVHNTQTTTHLEPVYCALKEAPPATAPQD